MKKNEDKFDGVQRRLTEMRHNLIREAKAEIGLMLNQEDKYSVVSDDADLANIAFRDSMQAAQFARQQTRLKAVEEALGRIENGTYGVCEDCGEGIPLGRLNAMPFALRCVECQESHEIMISEYGKEIVL
jgi:DnaK suppressor protein